MQNHIWNIQLLLQKGNYHEVSGLYGAAETFSEKVGTIANNSQLAVSNVDGSSGLGITISGEYTVWIKVSAKRRELMKDSYVKCQKKSRCP